MEQDAVIFKRIDSIMKMQGHKNKDMDNYLGVTRGTYTNWARNTSTSFLSYLGEISKFLCVSPNYLILGTDYIENATESYILSEDQKRLLREFDKITSDEDRKKLLKIVKAYVGD